VQVWQFILHEWNTEIIAMIICTALIFVTLKYRNTEALSDCSYKYLFVMYMIIYYWLHGTLHWVAEMWLICYMCYKSFEQLCFGLFHHREIEKRPNWIGASPPCYPRMGIGSVSELLSLPPSPGQSIVLKLATHKYGVP
jgi:hypothetical protein